MRWWGVASAQTERAHPIRGYFYVAAATLCWAVAANLGKAAFNGQIVPGATPLSPLVLSQARTTIAFFVLAPLLLVARGPRRLRLPWRDFLLSMLAGTAGIAASNFTYYVAIQKTTVAIAITLQYFCPIFVLLWMVARHQQRPTLPRVASVALAVVGSALVVGLVGMGAARVSAVGIAAGFASAITFGFYNIVGRSLVERHDRWAVFLYAMLGATIFWAVVNPPWRLVAAHYTAEQWRFLVLFSVVSIVIAYGFYFSGLRYLDSTRAVVTSCLEPVFGILLAMAFIHERPTAVQGLGIVVVLVATLLVQMPERTAAISHKL